MRPNLEGSISWFDNGFMGGSELGSHTIRSYQAICHTVLHII